ncbi:MAG: dTMP kinase [Promethearchaeia archaeon]
MTKKEAFFIVIDGIDGCGSSTHCNILARTLENKGYKVHLTQEPSSSGIGKLLRKFLKDPSVPPTTDALMFAADRDLHYHNEIKKYIDKGYIVISDRYKESSIVYQSAQSEDISVEWVKEINKFAERPDITIILDLDVEIALARKGKEDLEKFEDYPFLERVRDLYLKRAEEEGYHLINSDDILELVQEKIQQIVFESLDFSGT